MQQRDRQANGQTDRHTVCEWAREGHKHSALCTWSCTVQPTFTLDHSYEWQIISVNADQVEMRCSNNWWNVLCGIGLQLMIDKNSEISLTYMYATFDFTQNQSRPWLRIYQDLAKIFARSCKILARHSTWELNKHHLHKITLKNYIFLTPLTEKYQFLRRDME